MSKWQRILKHRLVDEADARRALGDAALQRLQERVRASERLHSGEIRICVEASLPLSYLWRNASARQRAVAMFGKLRVWDTEHNNGVLIYLLLAEHAIEIVADRGINRLVPPAQWAELAARMAAAFRERRFAEGLAAAVDEVHALLVTHFPLAPGAANPNELPDTVVVR
ncbi:MAG TPA: TPM domain-containing protein [Rhizobacter sp.]|nr:TPM domain-containing protein [Rhizobacter sp.]